ncbi:LysM peptidoglycan-binding domain-containing protein [Streptomyces sp. NPDC059578]|uniref:LysM peptidoglycan-binding domain-containing protein n=1 Tax=Streptomyces sp. NPDC059578 TaxID=3346874 RepID=UPI0036858DA3
MKGTQRYPGADTSHWYGVRYPGSPMEVNAVVLHTTEGRTLPTYGGGASAPTLTAVPDIRRKRLLWYQHFDFDRSSRALVNRAGGVETNTLNVAQLELVGTCDERNAKTWGGKRVNVDYLFWPAAPDWALAELAKVVRWAHDQHGVPMRSTVSWKAYKKGQQGGSYGAGNGVRLSAGQWVDYRGWLGHQHVPENSHGDPGDLDFERVLEHARGVVRTYTVRAGDTLWDIAVSQLGSGDRWREIATLNRLKRPDSIEPGQKLKIPKK